MNNGVVQMIQGGGAVALAVVVWYEIRQLRIDLIATIKGYADAQKGVDEKLAVLLDRKAEGRVEVDTPATGVVRRPQEA